MVFILFQRQISVVSVAFDLTKSIFVVSPVNFFMSHLIFSRGLSAVKKTEKFPRFSKCVSQRNQCSGCCFDCFHAWHAEITLSFDV